METIEIKSGKITFSDPCYELGTWCAIHDFPFPNGTYRVVSKGTNKTDGWGTRTAELIIYNVDKVPENEGREMDIWWNGLDTEVGVDSGQAGIYDSQYYEKFHSKDNVDEDWYNKVGDITLRERQYGVLDNQCVVSRSGYGDGGYMAYIGKLNEDIVAAKIEYIPEEEYDNDYIYMNTLSNKSYDEMWHEEMDKRIANEMERVMSGLKDSLTNTIDILKDMREDKNNGKGNKDLSNG